MERIQRKRTKGFRLPENTKCVNRGTKWGNPFKVAEHGREKSIELYREYIAGKIERGELNLEELRGYNLACFCDLNDACHADVLLELLDKNRH